MYEQKLWSCNYRVINELQPLPVPVVLIDLQPVSYTHLDVYKRQGHLKQYGYYLNSLGSGLSNELYI